MSIEGDVAAYMAAQQPGEAGYVPLDTEAIATATGHDKGKVNKALSNLRGRHKVEVVRAENGRNILGYRNVVLAEASTNGKAAKPARRSTRVRKTRRATTVKAAVATDRPHTPLLDRYATDRATFDHLMEALGDRVTGAIFIEDPVAEEGLLLLARCQ